MPSIDSGPLSRRARGSRGHRAFTLIELLVVVAIIALLVAILLPSLANARAQSKTAVCGSNLHQIATAIHIYAIDGDGTVPRGPDAPLPYYPARRWNEWASNHIWIGSDHVANGLGALLRRNAPAPEYLYCPADDEIDKAVELAKARALGDEDAYCSYLYRQLDETTRPKLDDLGKNTLGMPADALAFDANSFGQPTRTNHKGRTVTIVYRDGHAKTHKNRDDVFSIRAQDFASFPTSVDRRLSEIVCAADYADRGNPADMPALPNP